MNVPCITNITSLTYSTEELKEGNYFEIDFSFVQSFLDNKDLIEKFSTNKDVIIEDKKEKIIIMALKDTNISGIIIEDWINKFCIQ